MTDFATLDEHRFASYPPTVHGGAVQAPAFAMSSFMSTPDAPGDDEELDGPDSPPESPTTDEPPVDDPTPPEPPPDVPPDE